MKPSIRPRVFDGARWCWLPSYDRLILSLLLLRSSYLVEYNDKHAFSLSLCRRTNTLLVLGERRTSGPYPVASPGCPGRVPPGLSPPGLRHPAAAGQTTGRTSPSPAHACHSREAQRSPLFGATLDQRPARPFPPSERTG